MASKENDDAIPDNQLQAQAQGAKRFYSTGAYSDLTVICKGQEWKVHKFQVCAQSEFFHKQCTGDWKEAQDGKITLKEEEPQVVEAMLRFMYFGTYTDPGNAPTDLPPILLDVKVFKTADMYLVETLKTVALRKFKDHCSEGWATPEFAAAVQEIYATNLEDESMKKVAVNTAKKHIKEYSEDEEKYMDIILALKDIPKFAADVLLEVVDKGPTPSASQGHNKQRYRCPSCGNTFNMCIVNDANNINFQCPRGCYTNNVGWWNNYKS